MSVRGSLLRLTAVLGGAALVLHELRYLLGYGDARGEALADQGHAYLSIAAPAIALVIALVAAHFLTLLRRSAARHHERSRSISLLALWLAASAALLCIYVGQELIEGLLAPGHPSGIGAVLGHGSWSTPLLALTLGAIVALLTRGAERALRWAAHRAIADEDAEPAGWALPAVPTLAAPSVLARHLAGRAPPLAA